MKVLPRAALLFLVAFLYAGLGLLPGRTFAPLDLPLDAGAWKADPTERVRVSNTLLSDVVVQFIPWDWEVRRLLAEGELPWVNRFAGEGGPLFANPQVGLFSPFTWPRLLFGLDGWAWMALLKLMTAAFCAYWFARELEVERANAVLSALVYATAGYSVVWLLWPHTSVFALLPGLAAAALRLMKSPRVRNAALVILLAALCTAGGHPETLFVGVAGIWMFLIWEAEKRRELGLTAIIPPSLGAMLGFLLLAVQLVPFLIILGNSHAGTLRPQLSHPFRLWGALSQVLPGILGSPLRGELDLTAVAGAESFNHRSAGYIGALVLLAILLEWRRLTPALRRGMAIGSIALVVSWYPPGLWSAVRHVPLLRVLALEYGVALFVLFGSIAAGPALALLASRPRRKIGSMLIAIGILTLVAGVVPALPSARPSLERVARGGIEQLRERGHLQQATQVYEQRLSHYLTAAGTTTLRRVAIPGALWLIGGLALVLPMRRRDVLLSVAAVGELMAFGIGFNPAVQLTAPPDAPPAIAAIRSLDPSGRHFVAASFEVFPANIGTLYGIRDVISYDVLNSTARVDELLRAGYNPIVHSFNPILHPREVPELGKLGVRFVLSRGDVAGARRVAGPPAPAAGVYEIEGARPMPLPANLPPAGLLAGAVITLLAAGASIVWLRLFLLQPPGAGSLHLQTGSE